MYLLRSIYYRTIHRIAEVEQIEHFTGFGLYDRAFIDVLRKLDDPCPICAASWPSLALSERRYATSSAPPLRQDQKQLVQPIRLCHGGYYLLFKIVMRLATIFGFISAAVSLAGSVVYFILKLLYWDRFRQAAQFSSRCCSWLAPAVFIGFLGVYPRINTRVMKRPLVVEERRINFDPPRAQDAARPQGRKRTEFGREMSESPAHGRARCAFRGKAA